MTEKARLVLSDAKSALAELPEGAMSLHGPYDAGTIRRRYVALMALLRAVGHVLKEVYRQSDSPHLRKAIDEKWSELTTADPKPPIWDFIQTSRNAVLKRYEFPDTDYEIDMGTAFPLLVTTGDGPFAAGNSVVFIAEKAIEFWELHLDDVEALAAKYEKEK